MGKYLPLEKFLKSLPLQRWRVSFSEIEAVLGFGLPKSAYSYPAWWANDVTGHSHARAWLEAGWRTENVDIDGKTVTLLRETAMPGGSTRIGCLRDTAWLTPGADLTAPTGEAVLAERGLLLSE